MMSMGSLIRDIAHDWQDRGYSLVPLDGKVPVLPGWQHIQSNHGMIDEWFSHRKDLNIGINCQQSGIAVADCDSGAAAEWVAANLPESPMWQNTPRGGLHVFYHDPERRVPPKVNVMNIKLDLRGRCSQVVASPSVNRQLGKRWVLQGAFLRPEELPVLPVDWLAERARIKTVCELPSPPDMERVYRYVDKAEPAISGQNGHGKTFGLACRLVRAFPWLSFDGLMLALRRYNFRCQPPWSEKELMHKANDAMTKGE